MRERICRIPQNLQNTHKNTNIVKYLQNRVNNNLWTAYGK